MSSFVTKLFLALVVLSTLIGVEGAYAYSNVVAGAHLGRSPENVFRLGEPGGRA
jgi:hypothetical protein